MSLLLVTSVFFFFFLLKGYCKALAVHSCTRISVFLDNSLKEAVDSGWLQASPPHRPQEGEYRNALCICAFDHCCAVRTCSPFVTWLHWQTLITGSFHLAKARTSCSDMFSSEVVLGDEITSWHHTCLLSRAISLKDSSPSGTGPPASFSPQITTPKPSTCGRLAASSLRC